MVCFPRSSTEKASRPGRYPRRVGAADVPSQRREHPIQPAWQPHAGNALSCGDAAVRPPRGARGRLVAVGLRSLGHPDYVADRSNPLRVRHVTKGAGRFVQADVPVIGCIRFGCALRRHG
jgi:hypothetical protein